MITASEMRQIADETCTDEEYRMAEKWLYENMLRRAEHGSTMLVHRMDMKNPTPNFDLCVTRLKREFEEAGYSFAVYMNDGGMPCRIEIGW